MTNALFSKTALAKSMKHRATLSGVAQNRKASETRLNAAREFVEQRSTNAVAIAQNYVKALEPVVSALMESDVWQFTGATVYTDAVGVMAESLKAVDRAAKSLEKIDQLCASYIGTTSLEMDHAEKLARLLAITSEAAERSIAQTGREDRRATFAANTVERHVWQFALANELELAFLPILCDIYKIDFNVAVITERDTAGKSIPVDCFLMDAPRFTWDAALNASFVQAWEARNDLRDVSELDEQAAAILAMAERQDSGDLPRHLRGMSVGPQDGLSGLADERQAMENHHRETGGFGT